MCAFDRPARLRLVLREQPPVAGTPGLCFCRGLSGSNFGAALGPHHAPECQRYRATPDDIAQLPHQRPEVCLCSWLTLRARLVEGPHHDEECVLYTLPDYGVFGADE